MTGFHHVIFALRAFGEAAYPLVLTQSMKFIPAAGDQFMGIALMAYIPDKFVFWRLKDIVQGKGKFNDPETGCQMPTGF